MYFFYLLTIDSPNKAFKKISIYFNVIDSFNWNRHDTTGIVYYYILYSRMLITFFLPIFLFYLPAIWGPSESSFWAPMWGQGHWWWGGGGRGPGSCRGGPGPGPTPPPRLHHPPLQSSSVFILINNFFHLFVLQKIRNMETFRINNSCMQGLSNVHMYGLLPAVPFWIGSS